MEEHRKNECFMCGKRYQAYVDSAHCPHDPLRIFSLRRPTVADLLSGNSVPDEVSRPAHYTFGKFEVADVLEDWFPHDPLLWQVGKYIARSSRKGHQLTDLHKARWYLARRIAQLEQGKEAKV